LPYRPFSRGDRSIHLFARHLVLRPDAPGAALVTRLRALPSRHHGTYTWPGVIRAGMTLSLAKRAALWGERTALVAPDGDTRFSYAALADRARAAAGRFAAWGLSPGDRILLLTRNRVSTLVGLFGARQLGVTLAPVSPRLAPDTVATLTDRIDPTLIVHEAAFADLASAIPRATLDLETFLGRQPSSRLTAEALDGGDAPPLFLHTGGTTGTPTVVPVSESQLEWNAITESVAWGLDETTVSVPLLPLYHTGGWNLLTLPTLYAGGTVVLPRAFDAGQALDLVETHGATQLFGVAAMYRSLADHPDFASTDLSSLDWAMSGGGPCPESVMEPFRERDVPFVQGYGLTEGGPNNLYVSPARADRDAKADRVGRPFPDCEARLVDEVGEVVEGHGTGELELSGPVTATGYLAVEDGTFRDDGWVRTGDLAHRDEDGDYAIVGRVDNAFDSGGETVYPERVEETLATHPDVAAVGVLPISHEHWGAVPKAIVVGAVDRQALLDFAEEHLAEYEQPAEYELVDELPEAGPGKVDRDALVERYGE